MPPAHTLLLPALRETPRIYRMPALPLDAPAAREAGAEAALAFAIEAARMGRESGAEADATLRELFTWALAELVRTSRSPDGGDPAFQALVLRAQHAEVEEHVRLEAQAHADRRAVRTLVDAIAHPGKLRSWPPGPERDGLAQLHRLASAGSWHALRRQVDNLLAQVGPSDEPTRSALAVILASPSLQRLERGTALLPLHGVRRYRALCEQRGPLAGSQAAAAQGRAAARTGDAAEHATVQAFRQIAQLLDAREGALHQHRVLRGLRNPRGFPGEAGKAKDEWDAAIVRASHADACVDIVLLAEVKASPAAATSDYARLLRGLQRLSHAEADAGYRFPSSDGEVCIAGASLRMLHPQHGALPPHVVYCSSAPPESQPQLLSAASKAVLLAEAASIAFAQRLATGEDPSPDALDPVWEALGTEPRLRSALHQYDTARAAREAMVHPQDLLDAVTHSFALETQRAS